MNIHLPRFNTADVIHGAFFALVGVGLWSIAGFLKRKGIKTNYTRKFFHVTFSFVWLWCIFSFSPKVPLAAVVIGSVLLIYVLYAGEGNFFFEAIARESDTPHRHFFVIFPGFSAILGTLVSRYISPEYYFVGIFTLAFGDPMGEIVGTRYGRHKYTVPSLLNISTTRSIEGSLAVFFSSLVSSFLALSLFTNFDSVLKILCSIYVAMTTTLAEAVSPHGVDNFTIPIVATVTSYYFFELSGI